MWTDSASEIDMLFYKPYAEIVSKIAIDTDDNPLTIGVFGMWGAGKSTLLNLISPNYEDKEQIICVSINAWMFENYEDAKAAIMEALLLELEEKVPGKEIKKTFKALLKKIDFIKVGTKIVSAAAPIVASVATGNPLPLVLNIPNGVEEIGTTIKHISDSVQNIREEYLKDENQIEDSVVNNVRKFREEFERAVAHDTIQRVVVLIDDLDRCQPERIIETLEVIKLFLSVNKTTFIVAADENVIQYAIKKKYPRIDDFNIELDKEYIEKMIQLPIQIPELSSKDIQNYLLLLVMQKYMKTDCFENMISLIEEKKLMIEDSPITIEQLEEINGNSLAYLENGIEEEYREVTNVILQIRHIVACTLKGNPRQAKRFLNTFITKRQLSKLYYGDELEMGVMAKLLVLHKLNPDLFNELNEWNKKFDTENEAYKLMREEIKDEENNTDYHKWKKPNVKAWVECEPVELERKKLDKYFYLTREILDKSDYMISDLSEASKKILERVGSINPGLAPRLVEDMKKLNPNDLDEVMKVVFKKIILESVESNLYRLLFETFSDYRKDIIEAILKIDKNVDPSCYASFKAMYAIESQLVVEMLQKLVKKKYLTQKQMEKIVKQGD